MKIGNNYKRIIRIGKMYPQTRELADEAELMDIRGNCITKNIKVIKEKLELILNK